MKLYEFSYLIQPQLSEQELSSFQERIVSLIKETGGIITKTSPPVRKVLAYPIKNQKRAFLASLDFNVEPEKIVEFKKKVNSVRDILRYLLFRKKISKKGIKEKPRRKPPVKPKVELKEIEKKLEEILGE